MDVAVSSTLLSMELLLFGNDDSRLFFYLFFFLIVAFSRFSSTIFVCVCLMASRLNGASPRASGSIFNVDGEGCGSFLDAFSHLYNRVCLSVRPYVRK